jgi:putative DNA primase/helicase
MSGFYGQDYDDDGNKVDRLPSPSNPMAVARELVTDYQADGHLTLRRWRGGWMRWNRACWAEVEEAIVRGWVYHRLEHAIYSDTSGKTPVDKPWEPNRRKVTDVEDALNAIIHLAEDVNPPVWLSGDRAAPAGEIVACENGLLHVGTRKLYDHTPRFFGTVAVPFAYDPSAPAPARWLGFLGQLWHDDQDSIGALQEWFGYVLSGRTDLHKIVLLIGPTRSGKGTIARILTALVGRANAAGPTLASLGTNFGLAPLLGKPLAVVSDARLGSGNEHQVVERLLSISGEDMLTIDRKYREPWTGKLPTRFLVLSNELPRFGDASGAIANRFIVLVMTESFLGKENTRLTAELMTELPGILGWSLDGLDRLARDGTLTSPQSSTDAIVALHDLVSPASAFVRDRCVVDVAAGVSVGDLFTAWKGWAEDNGHRPGNSATLGRNLRAVVPALRVTQPREGEARERRYTGIRLRVTGWQEDDASGDHNGGERMPPRASSPEDTPERGGTRANPLQAQPCPRHTRFGPHPHCPDCREAGP